MLPASAGQYRVCVYGADPYLVSPPVGGSVTPAVASAVVSTPLSLQKGVQLIVRVHDPTGSCRVWKRCAAVP